MRKKIRKFKSCTNHPNRRAYSKGLCPWCYRQERAKTYKPKPPKRIDPISEKRKNLLNEYSKLRKEYLKEHNCCVARLPGCSGCDERLLTIHHKKGRVGDLLLDPEHFVTLCITCHRFIEEHPDLAKENGWSESRLNED